MMALTNQTKAQVVYYPCARDTNSGQEMKVVVLHNTLTSNTKYHNFKPAAHSLELLYSLIVVILLIINHNI